MAHLETLQTRCYRKLAVYPLGTPLAKGWASLVIRVIACSFGGWMGRLTLSDGQQSTFT